MTSLLSDLKALKRAPFSSDHNASCLELQLDVKARHLPKAAKPDAGCQNQAVVRTEIHLCCRPE